MKSKWEYVFENNHTVGDTRRLKVFGGWVFNTWSKDHDGDVVSECACFIPDPEHKWEI